MHFDFLRRTIIIDERRRGTLWITRFEALCATLAYASLLRGLVQIKIEPTEQGDAEPQKQSRSQSEWNGNVRRVDWSITLEKKAREMEAWCREEAEQKQLFVLANLGTETLLVSEVFSLLSNFGGFVWIVSNYSLLMPRTRTCAFVAFHSYHFLFFFFWKWI